MLLHHALQPNGHGCVGLKSSVPILERSLALSAIFRFLVADNAFLRKVAVRVMRIFLQLDVLGLETRAEIFLVSLIEE